MEARPLSVLLTNKKRGWSGETLYVYELARRYRAAGVPVVVASRAGSELARRLRPLGVPVVALHLDPRTRDLGRHLVDARRLRRVAAARGVTVLHTNASWDTWVATVALRGRPEIVRVRTKHNLKPIRRHPLNRWLYRRLVQHWLAPSAAVARHLEASGLVAPSRLHRVTLGVDLAPCRAAAAARAEHRRRLAAELGVPPVELGFVAVYVSRLTRRKNPRVLLQAVARLGPPFRAVFVGGGEEEEPLRRAGVPRVHVLGFRAAPAPYLAAADAFVLPAANEPFGLAAVEAMAAGTPVVLADRGGFLDIVDDEATGLLVPPDPTAVAAALRRLAGDEGLRRRLAAAGRRRAEERFSAAAMAAATLRLYGTLGAGR